MIPLFRYALPLILTGLIVGLVLRRVLGRQRLNGTLILTTALPLLIHAGVSIATGTALASVGSAAAVFGVLTVLLLVVALWLGLRLVARRPLWAFAVPLLTTVGYLLVFYLALWLPLQSQGALFSFIPMLVLIGSVILVSSALLTYAPRLPQLRARNPLRWFRRR